MAIAIKEQNKNPSITDVIREIYAKKDKYSILMDGVRELFVAYDEQGKELLKTGSLSDEARAKVKALEEDVITGFQLI